MKIKTVSIYRIVMFGIRILRRVYTVGLLMCSTVREVGEIYRKFRKCQQGKYSYKNYLKLLDPIYKIYSNLLTGNLISGTLIHQKVPGNTNHLLHVPPILFPMLGHLIIMLVLGLPILFPILEWKLVICLLPEAWCMVEWGKISQGLAMLRVVADLLLIGMTIYNILWIDILD